MSYDPDGAWDRPAPWLAQPVAAWMTKLPDEAGDVDDDIEAGRPAAFDDRVPRRGASLYRGRGVTVPDDSAPRRRTTGADLTGDDREAGDERAVGTAAAPGDPGGRAAAGSRGWPAGWAAPAPAGRSDSAFSWRDDLAPWRDDPWYVDPSRAHSAEDDAPAPWRDPEDDADEWDPFTDGGGPFDGPSPAREGHRPGPVGNRQGFRPPPVYRDGRPTTRDGRVPQPRVDHDDPFAARRDPYGDRALYDDRGTSDVRGHHLYDDGERPRGPAGRARVPRGPADEGGPSLRTRGEVDRARPDAPHRDDRGGDDAPASGGARREVAEAPRVVGRATPPAAPRVVSRAAAPPTPRVVSRSTPPPAPRVIGSATPPLQPRAVVPAAPSTVGARPDATEPVGAPPPVSPAPGARATGRVSAEAAVAPAHDPPVATASAHRRGAAVGSAAIPPSARAVPAPRTYGVADAPPVDRDAPPAPRDAPAAVDEHAVDPRADDQRTIVAVDEPETPVARAPVVERDSPVAPDTGSRGWFGARSVDVAPVTAPSAGPPTAVQPDPLDTALAPTPAPSGPAVALSPETSGAVTPGPATPGAVTLASGAPGPVADATTPVHAGPPAGAADVRAMSAPPVVPAPPEPPAAPSPEEQLAAIRWRLDGATLREVVDDRDGLRDLGDRLDGPLSEPADDLSRARLLSVRAEVYRLLEELGMAAAASRLALAHARTAGDARAVVVAQAELAHVLRLRGDFAEADLHFEHAASAEVPELLRCLVHENAGRSCFDQGRYMEALDHFARAIRLGDPADVELVERIDVALEAVYIRVLRDGWGPFPRLRREILAAGEATVGGGPAA